MRHVVSILIPAYQAQLWLRDTLESAIAQTYPWKEIIVVDDGSTDSTLSIARHYKTASLKVVTQPNSGASAARNKALSLAQGDYIQWLDADDLLAPDKLSRQLQDTECGMTSQILLSSAFGTFFIRPKKAKFSPHALWQDLEPIDFLLTIFTQNLWMNPAVWLVSRKLTELAGPWDERLSLDDDGEYFSRIVAASEHIKFIPDAKSYYRQHNPESLSRSVTEQACQSLFLSLSLRIKQLRSLEDSERTRAASIKLLQTWLDYFYPEKEELLRQVYELAQDLGGTLSSPKISWKYLPINALFGWKTTKRIRNIVSNTKLRAHVRLDQLFASLSHPIERISL
ncbi:MAG TPA: glycosyltransferase family A protein [Candidatus Competibacter sp.]|nr:glycosyltransferase family A protein [Candidatus Competibacter sp.]